MLIMVLLLLLNISSAKDAECWNLENKEEYTKLRMHFKRTFKENKMNEIASEISKLKLAYDKEFAVCKKGSMTDEETKEYQEILEILNAMDAINTMDKLNPNDASSSEKARMLITINKAGIDDLLGVGISDKFLLNLPVSRKKREGVISYDEWFNLINTKIKNGKKYSFTACVVGPRNLTAKSCNLSGSAAKRIHYSTDDIKDMEAKSRWINSISELKCVEAYVTSGQAFVTNVGPQENCMN